MKYRSISTSRHGDKEVTQEAVFHVVNPCFWDVPHPESLQWNFNILCGLSWIRVSIQSIFVFQPRSQILAEPPFDNRPIYIPTSTWEPEFFHFLLKSICVVTCLFNNTPYSPKHVRNVAARQLWSSLNLFLFVDNDDFAPNLCSGFYCQELWPWRLLHVCNSSKVSGYLVHAQSLTMSPVLQRRPTVYSVLLSPLRSGPVSTNLCLDQEKVLGLTIFQTDGNSDDYSPRMAC